MGRGYPPDPLRGSPMGYALNLVVQCTRNYGFLSSLYVIGDGEAYYKDKTRTLGGKTSRPSGG